MTQEHPITPPPELIRKWNEEAATAPMADQRYIATQAARWGADQQLAKDAKWLDHNALSEPHLKVIPVGESLKEAMRPKPPILTMTEFSPAAQAVLVAEAKSRCLREERDCHPDDDDWNGCWVCVHRRGLAAALRAAALHCRRDTLILLAIADELENSNG